MIVIGLTGGIGTGKSEVSRILSDLGVAIIDADKVGHEAYLPNSEAWTAVVDAFGREVLQPNQEIDRKRLGSIVFGNPQALATLNGIMHPIMYGMIEERINALRGSGAVGVVVEAAVLIEANWTPLVDEVWVTVAPEEEVIRRVQARNNQSTEQIRSRIRAQLSQEERERRADVVIGNDGDLQRLKETVEDLWNSRVKEKVS